MARINLLGGTYQARSIIADAQRCVNLFPEQNPGDDQDHPVTHYLTPGTTLLSGTTTASSGRVLAGQIASGGSLYVDGTYTGVPLTGGRGTGATATIIVSSGVVISATITAGSGYLAGDALSFASSYLPQAMATATVTTGGTGYGTTSYIGESLVTVTGAGSGAIANLTSSGGHITAITILSGNGGVGYTVGDIVKWQAFGGTGFTATVATVAGIGSGFVYTVTNVSATALPGASRLEYRASNGQFYRVVGTNVYKVDSSWNHMYVGSISVGTSMCSMTDNGVVIILVDGTTQGYAIDMGATYFGGVRFGTSGSGGTGYTNGTYTNQELTGGTGFGALATVVVSGGAVVSVLVTTPGSNYVVGDVLSISGAGTGFTFTVNYLTGFSPITSDAFYGANKADYLDTFFLFNKPGTAIWYISLSEPTFDILTGPVAGVLSGSITTGGSGYTDGTYTGQALTGGTGTGAVATLVVLGGTVTSVTFTSVGSGFTIGDVLVTSLSGSDFAYSVDSITGAGFDASDFAAKTGSPDPIVSIAVVHTEVWLVGELTTEIWYNAGNALFTFQRLPGTFVEHGLTAVYSLARNDLNLFWLSQDRQGQAVVLRSGNYLVSRISTHAIENAISEYSTISDAVGYTYQQEGHVFYVLTFPTANATWVYDATINLWHQRACTDKDGRLNRVRGNIGSFAYSTNVVGDYVNGNLYEVSLDNPTDYVDGNGPNSDGSYPISRIRAFPHFVQNFNRVSYPTFVADMETGNDTGSVDGSTPSTPPVVSLRWSDDRGKTFGNKIEQSLGAGGQYLTTLQYRRLGYGRDRVFELSWSAPTKTALQGAFIDVVSEAS